jgi:aromatic-L-amino-acid decarboxylase
VLSVVCFRYRPAGVSEEEQLNRLNREIQAELCKTGRAFLTTTQLRRRTALRCCFVNWRTTAADVEEVVRLLGAIGDRLSDDCDRPLPPS